MLRAVLQHVRSGLTKHICGEIRRPGKGACLASERRLSRNSACLNALRLTASRRTPQTDLCVAERLPSGSGDRRRTIR